MRSFFLSAAVVLGIVTSTGTADETPMIGIVNFATCFADSKAGQKEQESFEKMRKHLAGQMEDADNELREIASKFEDPEYLDSLSPKAEEELKAKFQTRQEDLARYQNQFYQMLNHAQMQMVQKMNSTVAKAAEKIANERDLNYVMNKEACFFARDELDVTRLVISEMDKNFELDEKAKKLTDNSDQINAVDETMLDQAG